jgi:PKD repeat protein
VRNVSLALAAAIVALTLAACGTSPPEADFSASPTSGEQPLKVTFTDSSTNEPTGWTWDFGDGQTSTEQSPTHEYADAGTFTVTLTASNDGGSDDVIKRDLVTVTPPPNPVCASLQEMRGTLEKVTDIEPSAAGIEQAKQLVADLRREVDELRSAAGGEYGDEIAKVEAAYASVNAAIDAVSQNPSGSVDEIAKAAGDVVSALTAVESAVAAGCD